MRYLVGLMVIAGLVLAGFVAMLGAQFVTQKPFADAVKSILASRAGTIIEPEFGQTARAVLGAGPAAENFGPAGATADRSYDKTCYSTEGVPLARTDATGGLCPEALRLVTVASPDMLRAAMKGAQPGDMIRIMPGTYRMKGYALPAAAEGRADAPITVMTDRMGDVILEFELAEGFAVTGAYWVFRNLDIVGMCPNDSSCEHAVHASGPARGLVIRNNRLRDFNSQLKINGRGDPRLFPDDMLVEGNSFIDSRPRNTGYPVTKVDAVGTSNLRVLGNVIADFAKNGADFRSYAGFSKGNSRGSRFERNLVICEWQHSGGDRIGLSLGGGGTKEEYCRDGACPVEDRDGLIRANIVIGCGEVGIYLRKAGGARVDHNLLVGTRGIDGRFAETDALISSNILDGRVLAWKGATLRDGGNLQSPWRAARLKQLSPDYIPFATRGEFNPFGVPAVKTEPGTRDFCGTLLPPESQMGPIGETCAPDMPGLR